MEHIKINDEKWINMCKGEDCKGKTFIYNEPADMCALCKIKKWQKEKIWREVLDILEENDYPYTIYTVRG